MKASKILQLQEVTPITGQVLEQHQDTGDLRFANANELVFKVKVQDFEMPTEEDTNFSAAYGDPREMFISFDARTLVNLLVVASLGEDDFTNDLEAAVKEAEYVLRFMDILGHVDDDNKE